MGDIIRSEETAVYKRIKAYAIEPFDALGLAAVQEAYEELEVNAQETPDNIELNNQKGYQEGFLKGKQDARNEFNASLGIAGKLCSELQNSREEMIRETESELVKLALAIAKKVIVREISCNPDVIKSVVKEAVCQFVDKDELVIKVNSADLRALNEAEAELAIVLGGNGKVKISADDFVVRGGCIIESKSGIVDADLRTRIEEVEKKLLGGEGENET